MVQVIFNHHNDDDDGKKVRKSTIRMIMKMITKNVSHHNHKCNYSHDDDGGKKCQASPMMGRLAQRRVQEERLIQVAFVNKLLFDHEWEPIW